MAENKLQDVVAIQMMDRFQIKVNGYITKSALLNSRKGLALLQYLVLANGQPVQNQRLLFALWPEDRNANPENALKTLVSRVRTMLNQISDGLGRCIVASHGAYQWVSQSNVTVDVLTIEYLLEKLSKARQHPAASKALYVQLVRLYEGDFMQNEEVEQDEWLINRIASIHMRYVSAVYDYIDLLKEEQEHDEICVVCRKALEINPFDDRLHTAIIDALVKTDRQNEAMTQYKSAEQLRFRYLGTPLSDGLKEFYYSQIVADQSLDEAHELIEHDMNQNSAAPGAYLCEYSVFKDIYHLQERNVERLGATMNLAVIQLGDQNGRQMSMLEQDNQMQGLMEVLRTNLRKGDLITRYNATTVALLLTMQDPEMGSVVLERIRHEFYLRHANPNTTFMYRVARISSKKP